MPFKILYKSRTARGSNYFKLLVEIASGIWEDAVYFGNTTPKKISSVSPYGNAWKVEIQPHTSRNQQTGRFQGSRKII